MIIIEDFFEDGTPNFLGKKFCIIFKKRLKGQSSIYIVIATITRFEIR